jgi:hypothetical protein
MMIIQMVNQDNRPDSGAAETSRFTSPTTDCLYRGAYRTWIPSATVTTSFCFSLALP